MEKSKFVIEGQIDISPLLMAYEQFAGALQVAKTDLEKAGTIQYFEFTYELAWKTLKRVLRARGKTLNSPKPTFREAALEGLIDDPELWFLFLEKRNETVYSYNKDVAQKIFNELVTFNGAMKSLITKLKAL